MFHKTGRVNLTEEQLVAVIDNLRKNWASRPKKDLEGKIDLAVLQ